MKRYSIALVIREMKFKLALRANHLQVRAAITKNITTNMNKDVDKEHSHSGGGDVNSVGPSDFRTEILQNSKARTVIGPCSSSPEHIRGGV